MKKLLSSFAVTATLAASLAGCTTGNTDRDIVLLSGAAGAVAGQIIGRDTGSTLIGAAAGVVAGTVIATTRDKRECYYANGRGGYYKAAC